MLADLSSAMALFHQYVDFFGSLRPVLGVEASAAFSITRSIHEALLIVVPALPHPDPYGKSRPGIAQKWSGPTWTSSSDATSYHIYEKGAEKEPPTLNVI